MLTLSSEFEKSRSTVKILASLLRSPSASQNDERRVAYRKSITDKPAIPLNIEEDILNSFLDLGNRFPHKTHHRPYWLDKNVSYNPLDILNSTIQCFDDHDEPLTTTTIPPERDVRAFAERVMFADKKMTVIDQLKVLLDITEGNILAAANIGFITTRFFARGTDRRVYPGIKFNFEDMRVWNDRLAQFEVYGQDSKMHAASDTYYFWTHFFVSLACELDSRPWAKAINRGFSKGTDLMVFTRTHIVGKPTVTSHKEASAIGRNVGIAVSDLLKDHAL